MVGVVRLARRPSPGSKIHASPRRPLRTGKAFHGNQLVQVRGPSQKSHESELGTSVPLPCIVCTSGPRGLHRPFRIALPEASVQSFRRRPAVSAASRDAAGPCRREVLKLQDGPRLGGRLHGAPKRVFSPRRGFPALRCDCLHMPHLPSARARFET